MSTVQRFRPNTTRDRAELSRQMMSFDPTVAGPVVTELISTHLTPDLEAWEEAEANVASANRAVEAARLQTEAAQVTWDQRLTTLAWTLRGPAGQPVPLGAVLTLSISQALNLALDRKVALAEALLEAISLNKVMADATQVAAFTEAATSLNLMLSVKGNATRARIQAVAAEEAVRDALDNAASRTARLLDGAVGKGTAKRWLPTFAAPVNPRPKKVATAAPATQTPATQGAARPPVLVPMTMAPAAPNATTAPTAPPAAAAPTAPPAPAAPAPTRARRSRPKRTVAAITAAVTAAPAPSVPAPAATTAPPASAEEAPTAPVKPAAAA